MAHPMTALQERFATIWTDVLGLGDRGGGATTLVVSDGCADEDVAAAALAAASRMGHRAVRICHDPSTLTPMETFGNFPASAFDADATRSYPVLDAAIAASDAAIILSNELALLFNATFREALGRSRVAFLPYMNRGTALRLLPSSGEEVKELAQLTLRAAKIISTARQIRLTSPSGTDLRLAVGQYKGNCSAGSLALASGFGGLEVLPAGQVATVPDDGSVNGRLVVDGSLNFPRFEIVRGRIELEIVRSRVLSVSGGPHAAQFERALIALSDMGDPLHVTEFGIGTNRRCTFLGRYGPTEDTHRFATVSMALGADTHLGGRNSAACHVDMALEEASVILDGQPFLAPKDGFVHPDMLDTAAEKRATSKVSASRKAISQ